MKPVCYQPRAAKTVNTSPTPVFVACTAARINSLAPFPCIQKENNTMDNMEQTQRRYIDSRLWGIRADKEIELARDFGIIDDPHPRDIEEIIERIQKGQYVLRDREDWNCCDIERIRWRDPAKKEDRDGLNAAKKRMETARQKVSDAATLFPIADAYKALNEFEAADFRN